MMNGAITQDECVRAFEGKRVCELCGGAQYGQAQDHTTFQVWKKLRLQMADEERAYEQMAKDDDRRWLCERRMVSLP